MQWKKSKLNIRKNAVKSARFHDETRLSISFGQHRSSFGVDEEVSQ